MKPSILLFCIPACALLNAWQHRLLADSFSPATPRAATSVDGRLVVRVLPIDGGNASEVTGYKLGESEEDDQRVLSFKSAIMPQKVFVSNDGSRIVFIDYYRGSGEGAHVIAIVDATGKIIKSWALKDFYSPSDLPKLSRSTSMVFWKGAVRQPS